MLFQLRREPSSIKTAAALLTQDHQGRGNTGFIFQSENFKSVRHQGRSLYHELNSCRITEQTVRVLRRFFPVNESHQSRIVAPISMQRKTKPRQPPQVSAKPRMGRGKFVGRDVLSENRRSTTEWQKRQVALESSAVTFAHSHDFQPTAKLRQGGQCCA